MAALIVLGRDVVHVIRAPGRRQYGVDRLGWSWQKTGTLCFAIPILVLVTVSCGAIFTSYYIHVPDWSALGWGLAVQILVVALAQELFFREAVLKIFGGALPVAFGISTMAVALFHLPDGLPAAVMASGAALAYMALRVAGMNILLVAAVHGGANVLFGRVLLPELAGDALWTYAIVFAAGHALFAGLLVALAQPTRAAAVPRAG
ncbi:CPBP family intramembrane glutamic endopeptidase [Psychromarinibacter sediminicola]|nr:CPBP family intramembrane glutamic endopeptidase [Psychromarinibacter sediminicola]